MVVVNPIKGTVGRNAEAETFTHSQKQLVRQFVPGMDNLEFGNLFDPDLDFQAEFIQFLDGVRFVYLEPK